MIFPRRIHFCISGLACIAALLCSISHASMKSYRSASRQIPPESIAIVSFFAPDPRAVQHGMSTMTNWLGHAAVRNHGRYALQHGYLQLTTEQCLGDPSGLDHITPRPWAKVFLLSACVERYQTVQYFLWLDADVLITNIWKPVSEILADTSVENRNCSIVVAKDRRLFNTGVILLRTDEGSTGMLNALMSSYLSGDYRHAYCCWEQDAMRSLIENSTAHPWRLADLLLDAAAGIEPLQAVVMPVQRGPLCVVRRRALQSFLKWDEYRSGDFAIHATCADDVRHKAQLLQILHQESVDTAGIPP
ncbi:unnamed protein product [Prorocentrum cordatum]|uniref:Uncharacterized protein n=1 Tax=Prorocentrum cordatum TaxID=2364126 RepID=A0ABN9T742_9DINO|nr:unnamed protein product [Polarella glacialis]|mmetsp:Transcript_125056/g.335667  ORF Transcript_125056/g.335667 Transcript_125056/m.335667 type:complete len:304 (-) Transcript_125056:76-987(-)